MIEFASGALGDPNSAVLLNSRSVNSDDKDRDTTIRGPDIFNVERWPTVYYIAHNYMPLDYHFTAAGSGATLLGSGQLKQLNFGAVQVNWKSTQWIADKVKVGCP